MGIHLGRSVPTADEVPKVGRIISGAELEYFRSRAKLSVEDLASLSGIDASRIARIEAGAGFHVSEMITLKEILLVWGIRFPLDPLVPTSKAPPKPPAPALPAEIAVHFPEHGQAVLRAIGAEAAAAGQCDLTASAIEQRSGTTRGAVYKTIGEAVTLKLIRITDGRGLARTIEIKDSAWRESLGLKPTRTRRAASPQRNSGAPAAAPGTPPTASP